ncbi:hypothetical protein MKW94_008113, partial [Papaver nudicaule]|nr:hypothetical protein [Papaver nudicaule]
MSTESQSTVNGSKLICETVSGSYEFEIQGYSLAKGMGVGKGMASSKFTVGGHDWVIMFYPDGQTQDSKEYVSAFVHLVSPGHVRASYELELLDQSGEEIHSSCANSTVTFGTNFDMWYVRVFQLLWFLI